MVKKVSSASRSKQRLKYKSTTVKKVGEAVTVDLNKVEAGVRCRVEKLNPGSREEKAAVVEATAPSRAVHQELGKKNGVN